MPFPVNFLTPAVFAFFRPLQFWVLTTQPLFLPFLFFPFSPHSGLPGAQLLLSLPLFSTFRPPGFPCFLPASCTWLYCMFPFTLPCFAPTAVPQVIAFAYAPALSAFLPLSFVRFRSASGYLAFCFFLSLVLPSSPHSGFSVLRFPLSPLSFPFLRFVSSAFPVPWYSAFCSFPFVLPDFAPTAVPSVLTVHSRSRSFLLTSAFFRPLPF